MTIAISEEHRELQRTTRSLLAEHGARAATRALLDTGATARPEFWTPLAELGLLGVHLPEDVGGGGFGLAELAVVVEELGRAVAPGPAVPTVIVSAVIDRYGRPELRSRLLPALAEGRSAAALALGATGNLTLTGDAASGIDPTGGAVAGGDPTGGVVPGGETTGGAVPGGASAGAVLAGWSGVVVGGALVEYVLVAVGDDLVVVPAGAAGVSVEVPGSLDPARASARFAFDNVAVAASEVLVGARPFAVAVARTLFAAEAVGGAHECVTTATAYAKVREQFGRLIGSFQAVKHHLANMLVGAELATAAVWDAARAASGPAREFELAAAVAAATAMPAFVEAAERGIQVHGGIGYTWEHDAHLFQRRALTLRAVLPPAAAAAQVTRLGAAGVRRSAAVNLPAEVEARRPQVRAFAAELAGLPPDQQRTQLVERGYLQPHWPRPWGIEASAGLQLLIEEEFASAGVRRPNLMITGWVILTLIQHSTAEQVDRWAPPALAGDVIWCQLFSEPAAGSDAAAVRTKAVRVEGGWRVNGQKVWTSDTDRAGQGLATVRTDPAAAKHAGITAMVIDMAAPGVEVRPLRQTTGDSGFSEVFLTDVFVPDADVVGAPGTGWTVARSTLGNERVSLGGGVGGLGPDEILGLYGEYGHRLSAPETRVGLIIAEALALRALNLRRAQRAVAGGEPGPEGNVTKLVLAEHGQRVSALLGEFAGEDVALSDDLGGAAGRALLGTRALTIAGGTSEITRNQIAERILGLPREPAIR
ncbi:Acyl-CoA dehydrogenase FadE34 [Frankia sp. AiPs1]|uniref:acyl-CoA dehydrogenase n=1 Tax=Frankia sp. AiPa1 TaxID=573492 RepID=UPI00202B08C6|nr:acyl-CoA dehydrogenase [Frankia sp. AiPa1]MCL9760224.1 acyl-CoA dehydrogenase [Frankia sp. AiPa1]